MTGAALYARVSAQAQAGEGRVSISEQFSDMKSYCTTNGYKIAARYRDVGSGTTKNRPGFQRMLGDARSGSFDVILCWKSDRLSRGIFPAAALMEVVEITGIELESVKDTIESSTFALFAAVGKIEIDNVRERATMGKQGAAKKGRWPVGNLPYGYTRDADGTPEIDPE